MRPVRRPSDCYKTRTIIGQYELLRVRGFAKSYQGPKVIPDFRDVRVQANRPRIRIKGISVLIDLIVKYTNGAPESGITAISIDRLLVGFVRFRVFLLRHVASSEKIPALRIRIV